MKHASLFSGIGGFDLTAEWMGWENVFHCEINPFGKKVLNYYWPKSISYADITKTDFTIHRGTIDVLTGGFPCQPYSVAGKRLGKEDERHLWPEMLRAIREIKPTWVVGENVRGLVSWSEGLVFEQVCSDLEIEGYEVQPFILPAGSVNAPHRRDRVWFVAHRSSERSKDWKQNGERKDATENKTGMESKSERFGGKQPSTNSSDTGIESLQQGRKDRIYRLRNLANSNKFNDDISGLRASKVSQFKTPGIFKSIASHSNCNDARGCEHGETGCEKEKTDHEKKERKRIRSKFKRIGCKRNTPNSNCERCEKQHITEFTKKQGFITGINDTQWRNFPSQSPVCSRNDGISSGLVGITVSKHRNESIKGYGNAIVPQVALQIFKSIQEYENKNK